MCVCVCVCVCFILTKAQSFEQENGHSVHSKML